MSSSDSASGVASSESTSVPMKLAIRSIKTRFPSVSTVDTETVFSWLHSYQKEVFLLDVREKQEYDVSHIEGARRVSPEMSDIATVVGSKEGLFTGVTKIVCYCSLGYRSAAYAKALVNWFDRESSRRDSLMLPKVYNMEGSIFKWANEKKPLVNDAGKTVFAHPYNQMFGKLLQKELRRTEANK